MTEVTEVTSVRQKARFDRSDRSDISDISLGVFNIACECLRACGLAQKRIDQNSVRVLAGYIACTEKDLPK